MLTLNRRELQKAIWRLDRCTCVDNEYARQSENFASDDEVLELTGKPAVAETLLSYWHCDSWEKLTSETEKTKFLLEALEDVYKRQSLSDAKCLGASTHRGSSNPGWQTNTLFR